MKCITTCGTVYSLLHFEPSFVDRVEHWLDHKGTSMVQHAYLLLVAQAALCCLHSAASLCRGVE